MSVLATLVAFGLVLLTGVSGQTSFGQASFVGIAAYATTLLTKFAGAPPIVGPGRRPAAHRRDRLAPGAGHSTTVRPFPGARFGGMGHQLLLVVRHTAAAARLQRHRQYPTAQPRPALRGKPAGQSRRDLGRRCTRHGDVRQFARQPHRPGDPHAERRPFDGRERGDRHRAPEPVRFSLSPRCMPALRDSCSRISSGSSARRRSAWAPASTTCSWSSSVAPARSGEHRWGRRWWSCCATSSTIGFRASPVAWAISNCWCSASP